MKFRLTKKVLLVGTLLIFIIGSTKAQVTIGSGISPNRAALLELKNKQTEGRLSSVSDDKNITSDIGGFLLPRVKLVDINTLEPFIAANDAEFVANTNSMKERLAGLMVYNITDNGPSSNLYPAIYSWNGANWETSQVNEAISQISVQPKKFSFYENGTETVAPLTFKADGLGTWTYQWYQVTGSNVHVRIGTEVGKAGTIYTNTTAANNAGANSTTFTPQNVIKGTTRNGRNAGFYRFYCVAKSSLGAEFSSDIAEVAVGCGAKDKEGEWLSFMCYNLGAGENPGTESFNGISISEQKAYTFPGYTNDPATSVHTYIPGEEIAWGSLFQWGRIPDGHESRTSEPINIKELTLANDIANGNKCYVDDVDRPFSQIKRTSVAHGKHIVSSEAYNYDWNLDSANNTEILWRNGRILSNDPCAHYNIDGSYQPFWHDGTPLVSDTEACKDSNTAWRMPTQYEWGSIYRGGTISGAATLATANTWVKSGSYITPVTTNIGYEIKPDGVTSTLFLPLSGNKASMSNLLISAGATGGVWSSNSSGTKAICLFLNASNVNPALADKRAFGFAVRCIKN